MSQTIDSEKVKELAFTLLEEAFVKVNGIFLDGRTSLMETLAGISAAEASRPITEDGTTIASQVDHLRFYIRVSLDYIDGKQTGKADWQGSWKRKVVSDAEWDTLRQEVTDDYRQLLTHLKNLPDWNDDNRLGGILGIVVHTAYHLGAIRQIMRVAKSG